MASARRCRRLIGTPPAAARRPTRRSRPRRSPASTPSAPDHRQPAAGVVELAARSGRSGWPAAASELVSNAAKVALPASGSGPVASATAPSQSPPLSSARICWWTAAYGDHGSGLRPEDAGFCPSSWSSALTAVSEACQAFSNARSRAAGDQGEALVGLGVEPGDAGLGRGQRGGVDAVAGGVDPLLDRQEPDGADHHGHEHHQRRPREREVDVAPGPPGQPDQGEPEHEQGQQAGDDQPQGRPGRSVELLGDAGVVGVAQVLQQREGVRVQVSARFLEVLRARSGGPAGCSPGPVRPGSCT